MLRPAIPCVSPTSAHANGESTTPSGHAHGESHATGECVMPKEISAATDVVSRPAETWLLNSVCFFPVSTCCASAGARAAASSGSAQVYTDRDRPSTPPETQQGEQPAAQNRVLDAPPGQAGGSGGRGTSLGKTARRTRSTFSPMIFRMSSSEWPR